MTARSVLKIELKKLQADAIVPKHQTAGAAGFDLHAVLPYGHNKLWIEPGEVLKVGTGVAVSINDPEWALFLLPRSSLGKIRVRLANCVGLIDSDYQGELLVVMENAGEDSFCVERGDRIAQGVFMPVRQAEFMVVEEFSVTTERGSKGFGSTGVGA